MRMLRMKVVQRVRRVRRKALREALVARGDIEELPIDVAREAGIVFFQPALIVSSGKTRAYWPANVECSETRRLGCLCGRFDDRVRMFDVRQLARFGPGAFGQKAAAERIWIEHRPTK